MSLTLDCLSQLLKQGLCCTKDYQGAIGAHFHILVHNFGIMAVKRFIL